MGNERGSATLSGILMMLLLGAMGATLLLLSNTDIQIAANQRDGMAAQYWAEAGVQAAVTKLKTDTEFVSQTEKYLHKDVADLPSTIAGVGSYTVQTGPDTTSTNKNLRLIVATGRVNQANRQVSAHITLPKPGDDLKTLAIVWNSN